MVNPRAEALWPESISLYDITLPTPEENLAFDEALLTAVEADSRAACLRVWEPKQYFVVLGRSNRAETEVIVDDCVAAGISVFRRFSGGGTVLVGPGCLCYSLALPLSDLHRTLGIGNVAKELMTRTATKLNVFFPEVHVRGTSDLTIGNLKFSGNAQRWLRHSFLHHGTILYNFDISSVERFLRHPMREPDYRDSRRHRDFITNLPIDPLILRSSLSSAWHANPTDTPAAVIETASRVAASRYASVDWKLFPEK